jgi:hypothetical protein
MAEEMRIIRRSRAKEKADFSEDSAVLNLDSGAVLKVLSAQRFDAKFNDETGDLWRARIAARLLVLDDRTEDGEDDSKQFTDYFDLKMDLDVMDRLGLDDDDLRDATEDDFTDEQVKAILNPGNWTIRDNTKAEKLNNILLDKDWAEKGFHPGLWENKTFIAKVKPRTGRRTGSFCGWDTFVSVNPPKKKKQNAYEESLDQVEQELTEAEEAQMHAALGS